MSSSTDSRPDHTSDLDGQPDRMTGRQIDWNALTDATETRSDRTATGLLAADAPLDPTRERVPVADLHPDRLHAPTTQLQHRLERRYAENPAPGHWIHDINPGFLADAIAGAPGRTTNCAECARAFQQTLDGTPTVAAEITDAGLPVQERAHDQGGEALRYTEQWGGTNATASSYETIHQRLSLDRGSTIIHAYGPEGGHAFNAFWDTQRGTVRFADAQQGVLGDWPPTELTERFPRSYAIYFPPLEQKADRDD